MNQPVHTGGKKTRAKTIVCVMCLICLIPTNLILYHQFFLATKPTAMLSSGTTVNRTRFLANTSPDELPNITEDSDTLSNGAHVNMTSSSLDISLWKVPNTKERSVTLVSDNVTSVNMDAFLVDTPACKIPNVDPFHSSIRQFVTIVKRITCKHTASLTYEDGLQLHVNWTAINEPPYYGNVSHCIYLPMYRPKYEPTFNNYWKYLKESKPFNDTVVISDEYVRVTCYSNHGNPVYKNVHSFIQPNINVDEVLKERLKQHTLRDKITEHPNVIMVGVDSVSRLSYLRHMNKTRQFFSDKLGAADMQGYNKVADNTFVNIIPMTLGKFISELPWNDTMSKIPFDNYPFIWKQFSASGYKTLYAEDAPKMSIFDYVKAGFSIPPTDYFNRPATLAMELMKGLWSTDHHCYRDRPETEIVLDYLYKFIDTCSASNDPYFAFTFITRLTHDDVNGAGAADEFYYRFFKKLHDEELLTNTVIFFFSDHGIRFGKLRQTDIGKLEERLPFMLVSPPISWNKKYTFLKHNLQTNTKRLSTPFDVYETLHDILYFTGSQNKADNTSRGVSWFRKIPIERSCDQAGILPHWCTCLQYGTLQTTDELAKKSSNALLFNIQNVLNNYSDICEELSLFEIKGATRLVGSATHLNNKTTDADVINKKLYFGKKTKKFEDIQVVIVTAPGHAMFEATVRVNTAVDTYAVVGDISRINKYGNLADCMPNFKLRKFCLCRLLHHRL